MEGVTSPSESLRHASSHSRKWRARVAVMLVLTLATLEICSRLYLAFVLQKSSNRKFRFNSYRIYEHVPGFKEGDGRRNWIEINQQGFRRSTDTTKSKPTNTYRIFLMGGSAAHGISSAAPYPIAHLYGDETIDYYLEQTLKREYPNRNFEVINVAVTGYMVFQHTAYLLSELLDYNPDLVIFYDGINDHYIDNPKYDYYGGNRYQFWKDRLQNPSAVGLVDYVMTYCSSFSGFARGFTAWRLVYDASQHDDPKRYDTMHISHSTEGERIAAHRKAAEKTFLRSIETNILILQAHGVRAVVTLQGELALRSPELLSKAEDEFHCKDLNMTCLHPVVVGEVSMLCNKYHVPFVDCLGAFNEPAHRGQQLFIDYCHLTAAGSKVVAEAVLPAVKDGLAHIPGESR